MEQPKLATPRRKNYRNRIDTETEETIHECTGCGVKKPNTEYGILVNTKSGRRRQCRDCYNEMRRRAHTIKVTKERLTANPEREIQRITSEIEAMKGLGYMVPSLH